MWWNSGDEITYSIIQKYILNMIWSIFLLYHITLYYIIWYFYYIILYCIILYFIMLCYVLSYIILYYTVLYFIIFYYIILHCIILYFLYYMILYYILLAEADFLGSGALQECGTCSGYDSVIIPRLSDVPAGFRLFAELQRRCVAQHGPGRCWVSLHFRGSRWVLLAPGPGIRRNIPKVSRTSVYSRFLRTNMRIIH